MGEMRDSDWSRPKILRSDWLGLIGAIMTTFATRNGELARRLIHRASLKLPKSLNQNFGV